MRPRSAVALSLLAALAGGLVALVLGRVTGVLGDNTTTVVRQIAAPLTEPAPAVVRVQSVAGGFSPARIYAARLPGVVTIFASFDSSSGEAAQGSGFVVTPTGYVLTNSHVITNAGEQGPAAVPSPAERVYVEFSDHDRVPARIVGWDIFDDVGLLHVDPGSHVLAPVPLGRSSRVAIGEPVAAMGSPFGNENSLAVGVVSARRTIRSLTSEYSVVDALQTDARITHGSSGGPLFDAGGRVIGINAQINSDTGANDGGVGFAIPIDAARRSMRQLIASGRVSYAYAGVQTEELTPFVARRLRLPVSRGAVITGVQPDSPASQAGLRGGKRDVDVEGVSFRVGGDVIVAIGGQPVRSGDDIVRAVSALAPGTTVRVTVYRGAQRLVVRVRLAARPLRP
jgi:S1-C subfamily serine protease